ncbi:MAG: DUF3192 domain-containing protein [Shewanella sp.]
MMNTRLTQQLIAVTLFGVASLGLSGCVVNVGDGEAQSQWRESWQQQQEQNRTYLTKLSLGMSQDQVMTLMGTPAMSEAYIQPSAQQGEAPKEVLVLFYRTQRNQEDGKTTKDECTPIVFRNNALIGWGETAYSKI